MPSSKKRKAHIHPHTDFIPHEKKRKTAVPYVMVICTLFAIGIAYFATGNSVIGLSAGALAGLIIGYFAGKQLDKAFEK